MLALHSVYSRTAWQSAPLPAAQGRLQSTAAAQSGVPVEPPASQAAPRLSSALGSTLAAPALRGAQAYQAIQATAAPTDDSQNPYAKTILGFMAQQLARDVADGASAEALQNRLAAGLKGFESGFQQASSQLQAAGLLTDDIATAIGQTHSQVLEGINTLAKAYGLAPLGDSASTPEAPAEVPQPPAPMASLHSLKKALIDQLPKPEDLLQQLADTAADTRISQGQSRRFEFQLVTQEGDTITLSAGADALQVGQRDNNGLQGVHQASSHMGLQVEGDLNAQELEAINGLLDKVTQLSGTFFNGDVEAAFQQALHLGYDQSQISQFALNLQRVDVQKVQQAYTPVSHQGELASPLSQWDAVGQFVKQLEEARQFVQKQQWPLEWITEITQQYSDYAFSDRKEVGALGERVGQWLAV